MNHAVFEKYRIKKKLTKQEVAKRLGKTPGWYSKLISGEMNLRAQYVEDMANALGISKAKLAKEYFSSPNVEDSSSNDNQTA